MHPTDRSQKRSANRSARTRSDSSAPQTVLELPTPVRRPHILTMAAHLDRKWFDNRRQADRRPPRPPSRRRGGSGSRRSSSRSSSGGGRAASISPSAIGKKLTQAKIKSPVKQKSGIRGGRVGYTTASMAHADLAGGPPPCASSAQTLKIRNSLRDQALTCAHTGLGTILVSVSAAHYH